MIQWGKKNKIVVLYAIYAILIELLAVYSVDNNLFIKKPLIMISLLVLFMNILLLLKSNKSRCIIGCILLLIQGTADIIFVVIYDMTGTYFDFGMMNLRNDAFGILESIPMNLIAFYSVIFCFSLFLIFAKRQVKKEKTIIIKKKNKIISMILIIVSVMSLSIVLYFNNVDKENKYENMLNSVGSCYTNYGVIGNFLNEMTKDLLFNKPKEDSVKEVNSFLYKNVMEQTEEFGVSKGNNLVVVLVESFEWFSFIQNDEYPNGLHLSEEELEYLFPNLTKFYKESVIMDNFHSREKTDISETLSILGSYPTESYVNYDFYENTIPHTIPNLMRMESGEDIYCRSFHDGGSTFYNRNKIHSTFGFDNLTACNDMYAMAQYSVESGETDELPMIDYKSNGERNLDSQMLETCKDAMFPVDKRFNTYITTITMHGVYYERDNLAEYREKLNKVHTWNKEDEKQQTLRNYITACMDFDKALGIMINDLDKKGLLDNTTIVLFGDHNTYYQQLSNYVKDIDDLNTKNNYTDLYKVPLMIYDENLEPQVIDKFTCTSDIVPTVLDLLGINVYENMYYGHSVFSEEESVLYSRAYNVFIGDGIFARSLGDRLFTDKSVNKDYINRFNQQAKELVEEIEYCDQIFYKDFFSKEEELQLFESKMKEIN